MRLGVLEAATKRRDSEGLELELMTNRASNITLALRENGMLGDNFGFHLTNMLRNPVKAKEIEFANRQIGETSL
ncbi:hypothetical protein QJS10_CPB17g00591 [Acorus calamus]|uniref:Uncharacterized protein n=1 Tax=Acorus calamus TaxID=4465 RepID=A0AAV9CRI8_ACOCL|nr:hypothetical protein QJS10_CPB17g00591 [Acorus calamus]